MRFASQESVYSPVLVIKHTNSSQSNPSSAFRVSYSMLHFLHVIYDLATYTQNATLRNCSAFLYHSLSSLRVVCSLFGILRLSLRFGLQFRRGSTRKRILSPNFLDLHCNAARVGMLSSVPVCHTYNLHNIYSLPPCKQIMCLPVH